MKAPIQPIEAHCAVGPDGKIDIDLIRRNQASAQAAAKGITGMPWPAAASKGWHVIGVRVVPLLPGAEEVVEEPPPSPPPRRHRPPSAAIAPAGRERSPLLRCEEGMTVDG